jgi:hypothetical protein
VWLRLDAWRQCQASKANVEFRFWCGFASRSGVCAGLRGERRWSRGLVFCVASRRCPATAASIEAKGAGLASSCVGSGRLLTRRSVLPRLQASSRRRFAGFFLVWLRLDAWRPRRAMEAKGAGPASSCVGLGRLLTRRSVLPRLQASSSASLRDAPGFARF